MTKYSPYNVPSPGPSDHQIIPLHVGQNFYLSLLKGEKPEVFELISDFIQVSDEITDPDGSITYYFEQKYDLETFAKYGNHYLGSLNLTYLKSGFSDAINTRLKIMLVASEPENKNILTVINPIDGATKIKMDANNILHVVTFDKNLGGVNDVWTHSIKPSTDGIQFELLGAKVITAPFQTVDFRTKYHAFPRSTAFESCTEHHFWFKLSKESINKLTTIELTKKVVSGGLIEFNGVSEDGKNKNLVNFLNVEVCVKKKDKDSLLALINYPLLKDINSGNMTNTVPLSDVDKKATKKIHRINKRIIVPVTSYKTTTVTTRHTGTGVVPYSQGSYGVQEFYKDVNVWTKNDWKEKEVVNKVKIVLKKNSVSLDDYAQVKIFQLSDLIPDKETA